MQDKHFHSNIDMLEPGDALVMNDTRVLLPVSMVKGRNRRPCGASLLLKKILVVMREVSAKPAKRLKVGTRVNPLVMVASALSLRKN